MCLISLPLAVLSKGPHQPRQMVLAASLSTKVLGIPRPCLVNDNKLMACRSTLSGAYISPLLSAYTG